MGTMHMDDYINKYYPCLYSEEEINIIKKRKEEFYRNESEEDVEFVGETKDSEIDKLTTVGEIKRYLSLYNIRMKASKENKEECKKNLE